MNINSTYFRWLEPRLFLFILSFFFLFTAKGQTIEFSFKNQTTSEYDIDDIRHIVFSEDSLHLKFKDGSVSSWTLNSIGQMSFQEGPSGVQEYLNTINGYRLTLSPNPTMHQLNVHYTLNQEESISVLIYDSTGKILLEKKKGAQGAGEFVETVDVSFLSSGTYLCHFVTGKGKIIKTFIKQ